MSCQGTSLISSVYNSFSEISAAIEDGRIEAIRPNMFAIKQEGFVDHLKKAVEELEKLPIGKRLLEKIQKTKYRIYFKSFHENACVPLDRDKAKEKGNGCSSIVFCSSAQLASGIGEQYITADLQSKERPFFVDIAHELIHACHNATGRCASNNDRSDSLVWSNDEEYHTIMGFPSKHSDRKHPKITENAILSAIGLPERFSHSYLERFRDEKKDPVHYQRVLLLSSLYRQYCARSFYIGQLQSPPPPIINCTPEDFDRSKVVAEVCRVILSNNEKETLIINYGEQPLKDDFVQEKRDVTPELEAYLSAKLRDSVQIETISLMRLTALENEAWKSLQKKIKVNQIAVLQ